MIKYRLQCSSAHEFEAWFASSVHYEGLAQAESVACPHCGSTDVSKTIMAPNVGRGAKRADAGAPLEQARQLALIRQLRQALLNSSEDVGARFPEEARKIHCGEADQRAIRGQASSREALELIEEGIEVFALPPLPEEMN